MPEGPGRVQTRAQVRVEPGARRQLWLASCNNLLYDHVCTSTNLLPLLKARNVAYGRCQSVYLLNDTLVIDEARLVVANERVLATQSRVLDYVRQDRAHLVELTE